ncbi:MAG: FAD-dependent oxidoreductase [Rhodocyclaceae bacterium]|nr:FAD-dependent oxidoreductase [Rhodocyclaceae bacterium]
MAATSAPRVVVVGAGVVGTAIAYALAKRGARVTLIDREEPGHGASFGNSGAISEGSVAPLAMPGIVKTVPGMLLDPESPLSLPLGYLPRAAPWLLQFVAASDPERVAQSGRRLADLHRGAIAAHEAMTREVGVPELFLRRGHLHMYPDAAALAKDAGGWRMRAEHGFVVERLDRDGIVALEPGVPERYRIGMYMADHATILNPFRYVQAMARAFAAAGGTLLRADVRSLAPAGGGWSVATATATHEAGHVVVAGGAWSRFLLDPLGVRVPRESQRGYHVQVQGGGDVVSRTVVLADRKVFVTPMESGLRAGGTVEIAGLKRAPDDRRAAILERIARESFPQLAGVAAEHWMGHRPCMPDSVPVVGAAPGHSGLWLAVGHGHLGLTDSLTTGRAIAEAILGVAT